MRTVFVGPPGSGKGTQARLLAERFGYDVIGTGDLLRAAVADGSTHGKIAGQAMARGELVSDAVVNEIVHDYFLRPNRPANFVLDGYPRTVAQAEYLTRTLAETRIPLDRVIYFTVAVEELVRRIDGRRQAENRLDDNAEAVRQRMVTYEELTRPVVDYYRAAGLLAEVPATGDVEAIHRRVVELLK
ncbi:MAG: adenylate kinase [Gemmataceae bacterium]|nr:adenylate kinase [Gemmataceae bacterium]